MKKNILLFTLIAAMGYLVFSSNSIGAAHGGSGNRTGAKGSTANCADGGCHGASATTTASIRVDSVGGVAVTKYVAGMTYTVTVTGSSASLSKFGFQYAVVSGSGAAQTNTGTLAAMPTQVYTGTTAGLTVVEHSAPISGIGTPFTFSKSFNWTAPATAPGDITMYLTVNAVNGDGGASGADLSNGVSKVLTHYIPPTSVASVTGDLGIKAFPNPVNDIFNLQMGEAGAYKATIYDMNGKNITVQDLNIISAAQVTTINTTNFAPGMYILSVEKGGDRQVTPFVKQ